MDKCFIQVMRLSCVVGAVVAVLAVSLPGRADDDDDGMMGMGSIYSENLGGPLGNKLRPTQLREEKPRAKLMSITDLEKHAFAAIKMDRVKNSVAPLERSAVLDKLARNLALDMARNDTLSHTDSTGLGTQDRAKKAGIASGIYENMGMKGGPDPLQQMLDELEAAFMAEAANTPGNHRDNLLGANHKYVGVGVARTKDEVYLVQEYTDTDPVQSSHK